MRRLAPCLLVLAACSRPTAAKQDPAPVTSSAPAVSASVASPATPVPKEHVYRASLARIEGGLSECADFEFRTTSEPDGGDPAATLVEAQRKKDKTLSRVAKGCREQFSDRTALATCKVGKTEGAATFTLTSFRYRLEDVEKDEAMKECLDMQGDWTAVKRDSAEWRRARLEVSRKRLEKIADKAAADD